MMQQQILLPNSSAVAKLERTGKDLLVTYKNSAKAYRYEGVPQHMWDKLQMLDQFDGSIGKFVALQIKPYYNVA